MRRMTSWRGRSTLINLMQINTPKFKSVLSRLLKDHDLNYLVYEKRTSKKSSVLPPSLPVQPCKQRRKQSQVPMESAVQSQRKKKSEIAECKAIRKHKVRQLRVNEMIFTNEYATSIQANPNFPVLTQILKEQINPCYVNCDIRYFNFKSLSANVDFSVIVADPPWRVRGGQQNDSQFMFNNSKFSLQYNTMANSQIQGLPIKVLGADLLFLWVLNTMTSSSIQIMNNWGYQVKDQIAWIKLKDGKIYLTHGYYFMHSYEICLVGVRPGFKLPIKPISNNLIFAEVSKKSQKPIQLYEIIELMLPSAPKLQIFARNHNLRPGWFSLGNQLGPNYDKWLVDLQCDSCHKLLQRGNPRFKSKSKPNFDLCQACMGEEKQQFYRIENECDEAVHQYCRCDNCKDEPIWGIKFSCLDCPEFDLCQNCLDLNLQREFHPKQHKFRAVEIPPFAHGFAVHEFKCSTCYQFPIVGICFSCKSCKSLNLCQNCFFNNTTYGNKIHRQFHQMQAIFDPNSRPLKKKYSCISCSKVNMGECWSCQNCFNVLFCGECYQKRKEIRQLTASNHKSYHKFNRLF